MSFYDDFDEIMGYDENVFLDEEGINEADELDDEENIQEFGYEGAEGEGEERDIFTISFKDIERTRGVILDEEGLKREKYNQELKKALENREESLEKYFNTIINWENYMKLNPELLSDVLEIYDKTPNIKPAELRKEIERLLKSPREMYKDASEGDIIRYWRFISRKM